MEDDETGEEIIEIEGTDDIIQAHDGESDDNDCEDLDVDDSCFTFSHHKEPVYCLDIYRGSEVVISGSQDERAYVWDMKSKEPLAEITGHKDTIVSASFHSTEPCLATADMLGLIQVFSTESKEKLWSFECGSDLEIMFWHPIARVVFVGLGNGDVYMFKVGTDEMKCYSGCGSGVSTAKLTQSGTDLIVGYQDGVVKCWNLKSCCTISTAKVSPHLESPISNIQLITGSADDQFYVCNSQSISLLQFKTGKILSSFAETPPGDPSSSNKRQSNDDVEDDDDGEPTSEIETFSLCRSNKNLLCLGRNNGYVETWDVSLKTVRNWINLECGAVIKIVFAVTSAEPICLIATSGGVVFCFDALTGNIARTFRGHCGPIFDLVLSNDDSFFVTCSEDTTAKVFYLN